MPSFFMPDIFGPPFALSFAEKLINTNLAVFCLIGLPQDYTDKNCHLVSTST
jgi:hypothetical protein